MTKSVVVTRSETTIKADPKRVLLRPFDPGDLEREREIVGRALEIPEVELSGLLSAIVREFAGRHRNLHRLFEERFAQIWLGRGSSLALSEERRLFLGACFLAEYSIESAALFNPSMVPHVDQSGLEPGDVRFVLSLRATGEGHISSIAFREGVIHADHSIDLIPAGSFLSEPRQIPNVVYEKQLFWRKIEELGLIGKFARRVMSQVGETFSLEELRVSIHAEQGWEGDRDGTREPQREYQRQEVESIAQGMWVLARSNYEVQFQADEPLSERILFPATPSQRNGIEDARFVRFECEGGYCRYFATFTAYDGRVVMPQLVETSDFLKFRFFTLNGPEAKNKGMALFPRKIQGRFCMLGRQGGESISLMYSDNVHFWHSKVNLLSPAYPWEAIQIGNCGSPIETRAGWLVLSHGVGPLRKYSIGAFLLDLEDPTKVLGRLREPLLMPNAEEREGYVPNVVYSCGAMVHNGVLVIPYGRADQSAGFATVVLEDLLEALEPVAA